LLPFQAIAVNVALHQWFLKGSPEGMPKCFVLTLRCPNNNYNHFD